MKKQWFVLIGLVVSSLSAQAKLAIGTDAIKWLENQGANLSVQNNLSSTSAFVVDIAWQQQSMLELGLKSYSGRMFSSVYYQAGLAVHQLAQDNNELGITLKIGYETSPARHFVFFGTVQAEYSLAANQTRYTPKLGAMIAL